MTREFSKKKKGNDKGDRWSCYEYKGWHLTDFVLGDFGDFSVF